MSGLVSGLVLLHLPTDDLYDLVVALVLADSADDDGWNVRPSVSRVARLARVSTRTVQYKLGDFQEWGLLHVVREGGGRDRPTEYRMDLEWLQAQPRRVESRTTRGKDKENGASRAPFPKTVHATTRNGAQTVHAVVHPTLDPSVDPSLSGARGSRAGGGNEKEGHCAPPGPPPGWADLLERRGWNRLDDERLAAAIARFGEEIVRTKALELKTAGGSRPFLSAVIKALEEEYGKNSITPTHRRRDAAGQRRQGRREESGYAMLARIAAGEAGA